MLKVGFVFLHMVCWTWLACETCNIEGAPKQDYIVLSVPDGFAQVGLFQVNIDEAWPARIEIPHVQKSILAVQLANEVTCATTCQVMHLAYNLHCNLCSYCNSPNKNTLAEYQVSVTVILLTTVTPLLYFSYTTCA